MSKTRTHNEYFRPVSLHRKSCPNCKVKLEVGENIWSWGQYIIGKWRTITHFCKNCYPEIQRELNNHIDECGCEVEFKGYHCTLPDWLSL